MIQTFIEKNKRLLKIYCVIARIIGWTILVVVGIWIALILTGLGGGNQHGKELLLRSIPSFIFAYMLPGLITLGAAQLMQYLFEREYRPGWILRHEDKLLYLYAVVQIVFDVLRHINAAKLFAQLNVWLMTVLPMLLLAAKVLILVGLAQILKRLLPMIEESRTLV
jgi:hypothetical protein